jgi:hypothetical protein
MRTHNKNLHLKVPKKIQHEILAEQQAKTRALLAPKPKVVKGTQKLTDDQVRAIRRDCKTMQRTDVARKHGVTTQQVRTIDEGVNYRHVKDET